MKPTGVVSLYRGMIMMYTIDLLQDLKQIKFASDTVSNTKLVRNLKRSELINSLIDNMTYTDTFCWRKQKEFNEVWHKIENMREQAMKSSR